MVRVSSNLIHSHLKEPRVKEMFHLLERDVEVQNCLRMANVMAVDRLMYNDHGPVHSRITSGSAMEIFNILTKGVTPTSVENELCSLEDAKVITLCGVYFHDIGNVVHRVDHHIHGVVVANPILDRLLGVVYKDKRDLALRVKAEVLHAIFSHDEDVECLSIEAGIAKVADGTDMAEGRARIPYRAGKVDIHSLSALSIRHVEILEGDERPVQILVNMDNPAGIFQIEEVLERKIETSGISDLVDVIALVKGVKLER